MKYSLKTAGICLLTLLLCGLMGAQASAAPQSEPAETFRDVAAQSVGPDGKPQDVTVREYTYTFSSVPANAEEIRQYKLDSPYKTMALLVMAYRTWTPDNQSAI